MFFDKIGTSIELAKTSWGILMDDKKLLLFPVLSGIITLLVVISFILPIVLTGTALSLTTLGPVSSVVLVFLFYLASYFVVIFFNVGLITCVHAKLQGKDMTVREGIDNAVRHIGSIFVWAVIAATVGLILRGIEDRAGFIGQIATALVGGVWSLVTIFVLPVMIFEEKGVGTSLRESFALFRRTWGESAVGSISIALVFMAVGAVGVLLLIGAFFTGNAIVIMAGIALFVILIAVLSVLYAAMQGIFMVTLYTYAKTGSVPSAFRKDLIEGAFAPGQRFMGPGNI